MDRASSSLVWRTLRANSVVLVLALVLLTVTPVTVSAPIRTAEFAILLAGMLGMLAVNWLLVRRAVTPLQRLAEQMEQLDLSAATEQRPADPSGVREVDAVARAFTAMADRLAEERRATSRAVLIGQEGERLRVARELHDEVGQSLIAITLQAERASQQADPDAAAQFSEIAEKLNFNLDELRRIAHELRPETLDDLGLLNALTALAHGVRAHAELIVERDLPDELPALSREQELVVYRVAQEALTNAARHSGGSRAQLQLRQVDDRLVLDVLDDGRGLRDDSEPGAGIQGMRERALLAGGRFDIDANSPHGTRVELSIPLRRAGLR